MTERIYVLLEALGLLAIAAGVVAALLPLIGWAAIAAGGAVVIGGSLLSQCLQLRQVEPAPAGDEPRDDQGR